MRKVWAAVGFWGAVGLVVACVPGVDPVGHLQGAADFNELCAPCHGPSGRGDGPLAEGLDHAPADLTGLSARNDGVFPMAKVMNKIWGYEKGAAPSDIMPKFEPLMEGRTVLVDIGDGIQTPTPERMVEIANYVAGLQVARQR
jgi:hypothetical protein